MKTAIEEFTLALIRAKAIKPSATKDFVKANTKAKEMEKEQIKDAWLNSLTKGDFNSADEYYNQTFKSE
jgi:hypothetical protein